LEAVERRKVGAFEEGQWRLCRCGSAILKCYQGHPPVGVQKALELEEKLRNLIVSYVGINIQAPDAFYAPSGFVRVYYCRLFAHALSTAKMPDPKSL
jgi:hypothetical protein